jgi:hypothetical protein
LCFIGSPIDDFEIEGFRALYGRPDCDFAGDLSSAAALLENKSAGAAA